MMSRVGWPRVNFREFVLSEAVHKQYSLDGLLGSMGSPSALLSKSRARVEAQLLSRDQCTNRIGQISRSLGVNGTETPPDPRLQRSELRELNVAS